GNPDRCCEARLRSGKGVPRPGRALREALAGYGSGTGLGFQHADADRTAALMDLRERLNTATPVPADKDPFAEVKSRVHFTVIGDLGPQLYNVNMDPDDLRERVLADVRDQLAQETGISRDDRARIALEIADDIL